MRLCPSCSAELQEVELYKEVIDRCNKCGGAYFDRGELESIITLVEVFRKIKLDEAELDTIPELEKIKEVKCPADGMIMKKIEIAGTYIDICPGCEGIWLDSHEIVALKIAENHIRENLNLYVRLGQ